MQATVLVVDDRKAPRRALTAELEDAGFRVVQAGDGIEAFERFELESPDLVLSDLVMPRCNGVELCGRIRASSSVPVILFTAHGGVREAVAAVKSGADDFVVSADAELEDLVALAAERIGMRAGGAGELLERALPGESPAIQRARERIEAIAPLPAPVLITGEPGSGRTTTAQLLHRLGASQAEPFARVDAVGLEGWPRRAARPREGSIHVAGVEELAERVQRAWLRELDGGTTGARWIASGATDTLDPGLLLPELAARLARFHIRLPSLRERPEDVPRVARQRLDEVGTRLGRPRTLSPAALRRMRAQPWPGNVAELTSALERMVAFSAPHETEIGEAAVDEVLCEMRWSVESMRDSRAREERKALMAALEETGGNVTRTAAVLGRSRAAVYRMVQRHGVPLRRGQ